MDCKKYIFVLLSLVFVLRAEATNEELITDSYNTSRHSFSIGLGPTTAYTDYVSYLPYQGTQVGFLYQGIKDINPRLTQEWAVRLDGGGLLNPAKTARSYRGLLHSHWGLYAKFNPVRNLYLYTGGLFQMELGSIFFPSMPANTPAVAMFNTNIDLGVMLRYKFNMGRLPMELNYTLALPTLGLAFAPEYGTAYGEIAMGNVSITDLFALTSLHNALAFQNSLSLDFVFSTSQLRVSYVGHSYWANMKGVHTELHSNAFYVGLVLDMINITGAKSKKPEGLEGF